MSSNTPPERGSRRLVKQIVLTYTLEGDDQKEYTLTLTRDAAGVLVDGVVWSRGLMDRLAYLERAGQGCERVKRRGIRPDDGWRRSGSGAAAGTGDADSAAVRSAAMAEGGPECVWLHQESCSWLEWCDEVQPG